MPDSRVEKLAEYRITGSGRVDNPEPAVTYAALEIGDVQRAGLGVFDPADEVLHHMLGKWLQQRVSSSLPDGFAQDTARDMLAWLKNASNQ